MKNNTSKTIGYIVLVLVIVGFIYFLTTRKGEAPAVYTAPDVSHETETKQPVQTTTAPPTTTSDIVITSPLGGSVLSSGTIKVAGKALGTWYFEASAPFEIQDGSGKVLAQSHVNALADWMTTKFVPFEGSVKLTVPQGVTDGYVVFRNDNPSGDPTKEKEVKVPVKFK